MRTTGARVSDPVQDFSGSVDRIRGGDDGAERHYRETMGKMMEFGERSEKSR